MTLVPASLGRRTILQPGRNCWSVEEVGRAGLLIDARNYYRAFLETARQARHSLLIAGWRFNSDVRLLRGEDAAQAGGEVLFLPFLDQLCADNPQLEIRILSWDFHAMYALEWELFQSWRFARKDGRLQFLFDDQHPTGASHHQKFVVVDGHTAFVGGLDFNADDWDDRLHLAHNPHRCDSGQEPHEPYHDVQAFVTGSVVGLLAGYFKERWQAAGGTAFDALPAVPRPASPIRSQVLLAGQRVSVSRTHGAGLLGEQAPVEEIRQLFADAIDAAEELIYLENQYFSSAAIGQALQQRLRAPGRSRLDIVVVLPKQPLSWIEAAAMETPRIPLLDDLRATAATWGHRLGIYYSAAPGDNGEEVPVLIHSKLMIVDDRFLSVGSANLSNRSMGLDSELNLSWEAPGAGDERLVRSIRRVRVSLLAELTGLGRSAEARQVLRARRGLVGYLDQLAASRSCRLRPLTREAMLEDREWLETLIAWGFSFDPDKPLFEGILTEANGNPRRWLPGRRAVAAGR